MLKYRYDNASRWWLALWLCFAALTGCLPARAAPLPTAEFDIPYQLRVLAGGTILEVSGSFSWALPQTFQATLTAAPAVRVIRLESPGGHIQPAIQIAQIIQERGLDTFVGRFCASACTIAFLAGRQRWLGLEARLGFHQAHAPGIPSDLANSYLRETYTRLKVPAPFMARTFRTPPDDIWVPTRGELQAARLITDFSPATPSVADDDWSRSLRGIAQFAQAASADTIVRFAAELSELLQRLQEADPEVCWMFMHDGVGDWRAFLPQALLDALQATRRKMAEDGRQNLQQPLSREDRHAAVERLSRLMRSEGHAATLQSLRTNADHNLFCPAMQTLLMLTVKLPDAERAQTLRALLPRS